MRTTLTIDDDVLAAARTMAEHSGSSLGSAVSELARRGLERTVITVDDLSLPVFRVPPGTQVITSEDVYRALDEWP